MMADCASYRTEPPIGVVEHQNGCVSILLDSRQQLLQDLQSGLSGSRQFGWRGHLTLDFHLQACAHPATSKTEAGHSSPSRNGPLCAGGCKGSGTFFITEIGVVGQGLNDQSGYSLDFGDDFMGLCENGNGDRSDPGGTRTEDVLDEA